MLRRVGLNADRSETGASETGAGRPLLPVHLVIKRVRPPQAEGPPVILAVWKADLSRATGLYRQRWNIETLFAALKSRGVDLEQTHVTAPDRIERLIGLLALAFVWARLVGEHRTQREGPPRRKSHGRRRSVIQRTPWRSDRSRAVHGPLKRARGRGGGAAALERGGESFGEVASLGEEVSPGDGGSVGDKAAWTVWELRHGAGPEGPW